MATAFKGVQATKWQATLPSLIEEAYFGGKVRVMRDKYVLTADLAAGDTIDIGSPLPAGAILIDCEVEAEALGGSCTIDVGTAAGAGGLEAADADRFFAALPVSSATVAKARGSSYEGVFYDQQLLEPVQVQVAEHAVSSGATGKSIWVEIFYLVD